MIRLFPFVPERDADAVHDLLVRAFQFMESRIDPPSSLHRITPDDIAARAGDETILLARAPELCGCVFLGPRETALYVGKLAVAPVHQGRGIGRTLIAAAERMAAARGLGALELQTRVELIENHAAFAAMGFVETRRTSHPGFNRPTSITMRKTLETGGKPLAESAKDLGSRLRWLIRNDPILWPVLEAARSLDLPDWWIVSGALYNTVWNALTGHIPGYGVKDIDLFYFDPSDLSYEAEDKVIRESRRQFGEARFAAIPPIEIRNQARVHLWYEQHYGHPAAPLTSCENSIENFASESHAVGVRLLADDTLAISAPYGLEAIFDMRVVPNLRRPNRATHEAKAARAKAFWPELAIEHWPDEGQDQ